MRNVGPVAVAAVIMLVGPMAGAQLTLADAMHQADEAAYGNRVARGAARTERALSIAPLQGILPSLRIEGGFARTTDPIGVFGDKLRQGTITQADFDPARLNRPGPFNNYQTGVVLEQPLANADAWAGRSAANHNANASSASATWAMLSTRVGVVRAYYGAVLASERVVALKSASVSAHAHLKQTEAMVRQGLVTQSDALLAGVRAGEMDAELAEAEGKAEIARRQLAMMLGRPQVDLVSDVTVPSTLPSADRIRTVVAQNSGASAAPRADIRAVMERSAAAGADASRARATYLPRVNSFVRYDWNAPGGLYSGERNWTVGVMATFNPFGTATEISDMRATAGRAAVARARAEGVTAQAQLDAAQTRITLSVALIRLGIAEQSVKQSAEAHRIVARKYAGGLASITELLDAQATEVQSSLGFSDARYNVIVAAAERQRAIGGDPATLAVLDEGNGSSVGVASSDADRP